MQNLVARFHLAFKIGAIALITSFLFSHAAYALVKPHIEMGKPAAEYLPADTKFNPEVPTPEAFFGFPIGKWHLRHDQLASYLNKLAETSERVSITQTGKTHQDNPLLLVTITSPQHQSNLDVLRQTHIQNITEQRRSKPDAPLILQMGYGIHGNEPSASNAAVLIAYYLAAGNDERVDALLNESIVLIDPSLNPDGMTRFAQWANMHKGYQLNNSKYHREHKENWPSSRTNYYWFDLNRDWLLLTHPESQARVEQYQKWRPHVLTDYHEMGTNSTYFFQPGVRARKNPLTPDGNVTLTEALAKYHAKALDDSDQLYFTEEGFDDFYYGKGSSYPDAHGSIGILFEQASSRGHIQESINGDLRFDQTIQNQVTTSLSTFDGSLANKAALLDYQVTFVQQTRALIKDDESAGVVLRQSDDIYRFDAILDRFDAHKIEYSVITSDVKIDNLSLRANQAVFVPFDQPQYRLVKSLFSERTSFPDNTFYDVSNWNIALAFDVDYSAVTSRQARQLKTSTSRDVLRALQSIDKELNGVALAFDWKHYQAPALTQSLLQHGVTLRVAGKPFTATTAKQGQRNFDRGTIVIPRAYNKQLMNEAVNIAESLTVPVFAITSGLTSQGIDLGSRNMEPLELPKILLVGGLGTVETEVGEIWHYFDTRVGSPVTLVDLNKLGGVDLSEFSHIILASGRYGSLTDKNKKSLAGWVSSGGTLIGQKSALRFFKQQKWLNVSISDREDIDNAFDISGLSYADKSALAAKKRISGAAFETRVDLTHPLLFGFDDVSVPMFKTSNMIVERTGSPFETIATYTNSPLLGGYASEEMVKKVSTSAAIITQSLGQGRVIGFVDNVNFRGYWYGTSKLMANAVYMSGLID